MITSYAGAGASNKLKTGKYYIRLRQKLLVYFWKSLFTTQR